VVAQHSRRRKSDQAINCRCVMARWKITMSSLTVFGLFSVTAMLVCYVLENKSP
jgi:hypothetical protein